MNTADSTSFMHHEFAHDSIADLGYDWSRIGDPGIAAKPPFKVYLPRDAADVARAVAESRALGETLTVRGSGHSSNDLVLAPGGSVLVTRQMNRILAIDHATPSVTVEAGASLIEVDRALAAEGLGLPVVGDHRHITVGGFASVGGVSPASHRYGLFVDNVRAIDYVDERGDIARCGPHSDPDRFRRLLTGCGRHGVIVGVELAALRVDKRAQWLVDTGRAFRDMDDFIGYGEELLNDRESGRMQRGYWTDLSDGNPALRFGKWASYQPCSGSWPQRARRGLSQRLRGAWGSRVSGLPAALGGPARVVSGLGNIFAPPYQSLRDAETLADVVMDYSVGDPVRWWATWTPMPNYRSTFHRLYNLYRCYRAETGCLTAISVLTQGIRSPYLTGDDTDPAPHGQVMMICGVRPDRLTPDVLARLTAETDDICLDEGALRYLHSPTSTDPDRLARLDPNAAANTPAPRPIAEMTK